MTHQTPAAENRKQIAYGLDYYAEVARELWAVVAERGEIPGIEAVPKQELFQFFEQIPTAEWQLEMQRDPEGALAMLRQYIESAPESALREAGWPQ